MPQQQLNSTVSLGSASGAELKPSSTVVLNVQDKHHSLLHPHGDSPCSAKPPAEEQLPTIQQVRRQVMDELRETHAIFINPTKAGADMKTAHLRLAERDLADYLEKVRETLNASRQVCVVCMDRPPTVITLPCKHKVLCKLCASQVSSCPVCRDTAVELFEALEP